MREFVSEKIFHCKPNLAKSLIDPISHQTKSASSRNLYSTPCADNPPCPYTWEVLMFAHFTGVDVCKKVYAVVAKRGN